MKKLIKVLGLQPMDEMETHITLRSKSYAQLFTQTALLLWIIIDLIQAAANYDYQGNLLPWLLFLGSICVEDISRRILTGRATADDEEYVAEQKAKRPGQLTLGILIVVLTAVVAVLLAGVLRYTLFQAGVLQ